jgi:heptosyltransferase-2
MKPTYRRILISRMKFIGDIVLTTPVIRSVRLAFPGAYIAYMGDSAAVTLLEKNPWLDEIIPFDFSKPTLLEQPRVSWLLRGRRFDLAIDLFGNPRSALLMYLSGAKKRVGPRRSGRGLLYTIRVSDDGRPKTAIAFHNQYLEAAGIEPVASRTEIFLTEKERKEGREEVARALGDPSFCDPGRRVIGIHPGATWPAKKWFPERFAGLADAIHEKHRIPVVVTAGPGDAASIDAVRRAVHVPFALIPELPLRRLAAVIAGCSAFVSNDAGPMHIAAAVGTPTLGIFGPGEENIWFPYSHGDGHTALRRDVPCHPCHLDVCNREGNGFMECMRLLTIDAVLSAVEQVLLQNRRPPAH